MPPAEPRRRSAGAELLQAAGLDPERDIQAQRLELGKTVDVMKDGSIDAFVWSGGLPTGAITDLATTDDIVLLPLDRYVPRLNERYGEAYQEAEVEEGEYPGVAPVKTIAVPNLLMVRADMDEGLAHDVIALMFEHKRELAQIHPSAEKLTLEDAPQVVEGVELHPGAQRFYREAEE